MATNTDKKNKVIFTETVDFWLIKFPIFFPIIYIFILFNFSSYVNYLIALTIILLAEPHFGSTWTIIFDKIIKLYIY